ncbi:hypothetical protein DMUE_1613 [Dictyocoela muelleri]|nr:hypothetical protein DMUE_1613 [Dictyocoela muelleri]
MSEMMKKGLKTDSAFDRRVHDYCGKVVITDDELKKFMKELHCLLGHPGSNKLWYTVKPYISIKGIRKAIEDICSTCHKCQYNKLRLNNLGLFGSSIYSDGAFEYISSDIMGPIKTIHFKGDHESEYFHILSITDIYSRFTRLYCLRSITSMDVIKCFNKWFAKYLTPRRVLTDCGRQYISRNFKELLDKHAIKHVTTSLHNPTANSISE